MHVSAFNAHHVPITSVVRCLVSEPCGCSLRKQQTTPVTLLQTVLNIHYKKIAIYQRTLLATVFQAIGIGIILRGYRTA
jgi:hypothetical protein